MSVVLAAKPQGTLWPLLCAAYAQCKRQEALGLILMGPLEHCGSSREDPQPRLGTRKDLPKERMLGGASGGQGGKAGRGEVLRGGAGIGVYSGFPGHLEASMEPGNASEFYFIL